MSVGAAIDKVRGLLYLSPVEDGHDPRWQAIIDLSEYLGSDPEPIWKFLEELHDTKDEDLQAALTTCLLEHLLEEHPEYRSRAELLASKSLEFQQMLDGCW